MLDGVSVRATERSAVHTSSGFEDRTAAANEEIASNRKAVKSYRSITVVRNHDMIEQRHSNGRCSLRDVFRKHDVFFAWRRIAARVIVQKAKPAGCHAQRMPKRIVRPQRHAVYTALRNTPCCTKSTLPIHRNEPKLFVIQPADARHAPRGHVMAAAHARPRQRRLFGNAPTELERRGKSVCSVA